MKKFCLCIFITFYITFGSAIPQDGLYRLDIIHYNDFHARFEETSVEFPTCRYNNASCLGGFARLYYEIQALKKEKPCALLLNAGDNFVGTFWYTHYKWRIIQEFINLLDHDAHALGNHEFDDGVDGIVPFLKALKAPVVAANMDTSKAPSMDGLYQTRTVVERHGRKIGIIGLITTDTAIYSSPGNVTFTDPGEATEREAKALTDEGVDIIILLSHCGLDIDKQLAKKYGHYIDIIVGGHSHSLLWNGPSPSGETVVGTYPVFIETADDSKHEVLIVQASAFTKYMGNLSVYFDKNGDYVKWDGNPIFLNRSIPEDEDIKAKLAPYAKEVHEAGNVVVGQSLTELRYEDCVYGECALGDLLVDVMNNKTKETIQSNYHHVAFLQRGDIRHTLPKGNITEADIFELLPYRDRVVTSELKGIYLFAALEHALSTAWATDPFKGPYVLQVSGLEVFYDLSRSAGQLVYGLNANGNEVMNGTTYQVTMPVYLAYGGDGFVMFKNGTNIQDVGRDYILLENYLKNNSPINYSTSNRIHITQ